MPSGSKCLAIHRTRSILNSHILLNDNSVWLSDCIYLLTSKTQQTEEPYLALLFSLMYKQLDQCSVKFPSLYLLRPLYCMSHEAYSTYFDIFPKMLSHWLLFQLSFCKLASDTLISVLLSLWSARCLLSVCKLLQYVKLFMEHTFSLIIKSIHKVPFYKFFLIHLWMDISMSFYCAVNTAKIGVSSLLTSTWMAIHLC